MRISDSDLPEWERDLLEKQTVAGERIGVTWKHVHDDYPVIAPEDIRPGDVVERRQRLTIEARHVEEYGIRLHTKQDRRDHAFGVVWPEEDDGYTWHLVHRPDPDAEAVQAIRSASYNIHHGDTRVDPLPGLIESGTLLEKLRESGWDVVRRAES